MNCNQLAYYPDNFLAPAVQADCPTVLSPAMAPLSRRQATLNAASGGVGALPLITTMLSAPLNVVSATVDTRGAGQTNNLLHFSSIISLPMGICVTLNFQIRRAVNNGTPIGVGGTYTFSRKVSVLESESFSFQFFDPDVQPGFYTYSVELSTNSLVDVTPGCCVNNAVLSVLAVSDR